MIACPFQKSEFEERIDVQLIRSCQLKKMTFFAKEQGRGIFPFESYLQFFRRVTMKNLDSISEVTTYPAARAQAPREKRARRQLAPDFQERWACLRNHFIIYTRDMQDKTKN